jgi:hypothetical protein
VGSTGQSWRWTALVSGSRREAPGSEGGSRGVRGRCKSRTVEVPPQGTPAQACATEHATVSGQPPLRSGCTFLLSTVSRHDGAGRQAQIGFGSEDHSRLFSERWTTRTGAP